MIISKTYSWFIRLIPGIIILILLSGCKQEIVRDKLNLKDPVNSININLDHLEHLQESVIIENTPCRIVHIYCEAPDYKMVEAKGEGYTCVDDVARAIRFYLQRYRITNDEELLKPAKEMLEFILLMQTDDGEYYNFAFADGSINKTYKTSIKSFDWWAARGFRSVCEGIAVFKGLDEELYGRLKNSADKTISRMKELFILNPEKPEIGKDMSSNVVLALLSYRESTGDNNVNEIISYLSDYIMSGKEPPTEKFPFMVLKSWHNTWHAWGALQVEALARAGHALNRQDWIDSAVEEASGFQRLLLKDGFISYLEFENEDTVSVKWFDQIAYGISSIVFSQMAVYEITGDKDYAVIAGLVASWFRANNPAESQIYDPMTGRCFDGINNLEGQINRNSGAESTIEALLALQIVANNQFAAEAFRTNRLDNPKPEKAIFESKNKQFILTREANMIHLEQKDKGEENQ